MPTSQSLETIKRAGRLRKSMTIGELRLWSELKTWRSQRAIHWRKQAPLGPFVVDFLCHDLKLVVEVDGEFHFTGAGIAGDKLRDEWLVAQGYRVIRVTTGELADNLDGCVEHLLREAGLA